MNGGFSREWFNIAMDFKEEMLKIGVEGRVKTGGKNRRSGVMRSWIDARKELEWRKSKFMHKRRERRKE